MFCFHSVASVSDLALEKLENQFRAKIFANGSVSWTPFLALQTTCNFDLTYFPFDKQMCQIILMNWIYNSQQLNLTLSSTPVLFDYYSPNSVWRLLSASAATDTTTLPLPIVVLNLTVGRMPAYFIVYIILTILGLSILSVIVFLLPPVAGEKMSLSVTVLMSYSVVLLLISDNIPRDSRLPIMSKLLTFIH